MLDLIAGRVSVMITPIPNLMAQFKAGKLIPLAVTTKERVKALPDVPTLAESGLPGIEIGSWYGLWGPAGVPHHAVDVLDREIAQAMQAPQVVDRLIEQGLISGRLPRGGFCRIPERRDRKVRGDHQGREHQGWELIVRLSLRISQAADRFA